MSQKFIKNSYLKLILLQFLLITACNSDTDITDTIRHDRSSFYYIDFSSYPVNDKTLPIGIFDSGTGGLAVLNDILRYEAADSTQKGISRNLRNESYVFLADLANMPYGNYSAENNTPLLIEHIFKDLQFLLGDRYYQRTASPVAVRGKSQVKAVVIACNTATAWGLDTIRSFLKEAGCNIGVIGAIDAGARGAIRSISPDNGGTIAVLATYGTVMSGAYPRTIERLVNENAIRGRVNIIQHACIGIAEAVDENKDFIDRKATATRPNYKGPSVTQAGDIKIDTSLLNRYMFDVADNALLYEGDEAEPSEIQLNSVENYITFHVVSLLEKMIADKSKEPLSAVVLACTHYPFYEEAFMETFMRLRELRENGEYVYRDFISEDLKIVNPAVVIAEQLYELLDSTDLLNYDTPEGSEFYISVPNVLNKNIKLTGDGSFTYEYKYGRRPGETQEYVKCVPFSRVSVPDDIIQRLGKQVPEVFEMITEFNNENQLTQYLEPVNRITDNF